MSHHDPGLAAHAANTQETPVWYALRPEVRSAALHFSELRTLAVRQQLRNDDLVWRQGWDRWYPAHLVQGLFPAPPKAAELATSEEGGTHAHDAPQTLLERAKHELRSYLIVTGYIWAVLSLLRLHEHALSGAYGFSMMNEGWAIVTALILGKVVVIAEMLHAGSGLSQRFPSLTVIIKSCAVALALLIFHLLEHLAIAWWDGEDILHVVGEFDGTLSLIKTAMMAVAFLPYFLIEQVEEKTGQKDLILLAIGMRR